MWWVNKIIHHRSMLLSKKKQFIKACVLYIEPTRCNLQENKLSNSMSNTCFAIVLVFKILICTLTFPRLFLEALITEVLCKMSLQYWEATLDINEGFHLKANHYSIQVILTFLLLEMLWKMQRPAEAPKILYRLKGH